MVTFAALCAAVPGVYAEVAGVVRVLANAVADRADEVAAAIDRLGPPWSGPAALTARDRLTGVHLALTDAFPALIAVDQAVSEFGVTLAEAQRAALTAATPVPGSIVEVGADGVARLAPGATPPDPGDLAELGTVQRAIDAALALATTADSEVARRLGAISLHVDRTMSPPVMPPPGAAPQAVAGWWGTLTSDQRAYLATLRPDALIRLDGVPADARDQAARILLRAQRAQLEQQERDLRAGPRTAAAASQLDTVGARLAGLNTLAARIDDPAGPRAYLLGIDAGANRAIVSIGDPDRADDTLTFVPGLRSGLGTVSATLHALDSITATAGSLPASDTWSPHGDLATVGWLDYGAPQTLAQASLIGRARAAAVPLSTFETGLRADHAAPDGRADHATVLGYSYGSTVVGASAHGAGLSGDDIVFVGSPGTTVNRAADLGVAPGHVWATTARYDVIRFAARPISLVGELLGRTPRMSWFGANPIDPVYGAQVFASDPGRPGLGVTAHISYFNAGTPSVHSIAAIAVGDDGAVR